MTDKQVLFKVVQKEGDKQLVIAMEECAELIQAISKQLRYGINFDNLAEEMADVAICLEELKLMYGNDGSVNMWIAKKIDRLRERYGWGD